MVVRVVRVRPQANRTEATPVVTALLALALIYH